MRLTHVPRIAACTAAALSLAATTALASPPLFNGMGRLPGGTASGATGISANGSYVVGYCTLPQGDRAIRWSRTTGMQSLGVLPGGVSIGIPLRLGHFPPPTRRRGHIGSEMKM